MPRHGAKVQPPMPTRMLGVVEATAVAAVAGAFWAGAFSAAGAFAAAAFLTATLVAGAFLAATPAVPAAPEARFDGAFVVAVVDFAAFAAGLRAAIDDVSPYAFISLQCSESRWAARHPSRAN